MLLQIFDIVDSAREFLNEHYRPETSFYEEMLSRQQKAKAVEEEIQEQQEVCI